MARYAGRAPTWSAQPVQQSISVKRMEQPDYLRELSYEDFKRLAGKESLTANQKIGFPEEYRHGYAGRILSDIRNKLPALARTGSTILDIGCGCSDLPVMMTAEATSLKQTLTLVDSLEMLDQLPSLPPAVQKVAARYPDCPDLLAKLEGKVDAILVYSVIQYVFNDGNVFEFLDQSLKLLAPQGRMLIGDIPNLSMRKRFFASDSGVRHHQAFTQSSEIPDVGFNKLEPGKVDDAIVLALVSRARAAGFHGYVLPQDDSLPMSNRREDVLIVRP
jgi:2-polyprenyl-3-methyl-5-hydroxy-6-metoxy-1,4-benzoquinol methylase